MQTSTKSITEIFTISCKPLGCLYSYNMSTDHLILNFAGCYDGAGRHFSFLEAQELLNNIGAKFKIDQVRLSSFNKVGYTDTTRDYKDLDLIESVKNTISLIKQITTTTQTIKKIVYTPFLINKEISLYESRILLQQKLASLSANINNLPYKEIDNLIKCL